MERCVRCCWMWNVLPSIGACVEKSNWWISRVTSFTTFINPGYSTWVLATEVPTTYYMSDLCGWLVLPFLSRSVLSVSLIAIQRNEGTLRVHKSSYSFWILRPPYRVTCNDESSGAWENKNCNDWGYIRCTRYRDVEPTPNVRSLRW